MKKLIKILTDPYDRSNKAVTQFAITAAYLLLLVIVCAFARWLEGR